MKQPNAEEIERIAAADLARRDHRQGVATMVVLACISIGVALLATTLGAALVQAALTGAGCAVASLFVWGEMYRKFAERRWGAPFSLDERVRVVSGEFAGCHGVVVGTDQAQRPCVRLAKDGLTFSVLLPWHQVRRVAPQAHQTPEEGRERPRYPLRVMFDDGDEWILGDEVQVACTLEWFDSDDPNEDARVLDAANRAVHLVVKNHRLICSELRKSGAP